MPKKELKLVNTNEGEVNYSKLDFISSGEILSIHGKLFLTGRQYLEQYLKVNSIQIANSSLFHKITIFLKRKLKAMQNSTFSVGPFPSDLKLCTNTHCQVLWACLERTHKICVFLYHTYIIIWSNLLQIREAIGSSFLTLYYKKLQPLKIQLLLSLAPPQIILSPPMNCTGPAKIHTRNMSWKGNNYFSKSRKW